MRLTVLFVLVLVALPSRAFAQLTRVTSFGANPGALDMYTYVPADLPANAPLVVVLHGCSQSASSAVPAGWNDLADELGFAVVYPQQTSANNPITCFNWAGEYGDPANLTRGQGENQSIVSMVDHMVANHDVDASRVYVAGFSAGAAFTAVLLATWPDRFRAGAIMSGIPYRCATTVDEAYDCQQLHLNPGMGKSADAWGDLVRAAYPGYTGPYPRVQLWQGTTDGIVADENQQELIEQWTDVHGTDATADQTEQLTGMTRREFRSGGVVTVEAYTVTGMGHAVCVGADDPEHGCGAPGAYYEDRGTCSTWRAAKFFGLDGDDPTPPGPDAGPGGPGDPDAGPGGGGGGGGGGDDDSTDPDNDLPGCGGLDAGGGSGAAGAAVLLLAAAWLRIGRRSRARRRRESARR